MPSRRSRSTTQRCSDQRASSGDCVDSDVIRTDGESVQMTRSAAATPPAHNIGELYRERLMAHFSSGGARSLMLVAAPAGFGKTGVLRAAYATVSAAGDFPVWLTLEEEDSESLHFLRRLDAALATLLSLPQRPAFDAQQLSDSRKSLRAVARKLIDAVATQRRRVWLFLDDYQVAESDELNELVALLVRLSGANVHVVIGARRVPALPLGKTRATGQLCEIQKEELAFTTLEAEQFFAQVHALQLSERDVVSIQSQVHGWATGLQLIGLSLTKATDQRRALLQVSLRDRTITDYLSSEMLAEVSAEERDLLVKICHLTKISTAVCECVTGCSNASRLLERCAKRLMLLTPLDNTADWYQLHPVVAGYLRSLGPDPASDEVREIHRRAYCWYGARSMLLEAVDHCVKARDFEQLAELVERCRYQIMMQGQVRVLDEWLALLPANLLAVHPQLRLTQCWILYWRRDWVRAKDLLESVERDIADGLLDRLGLSAEGRAQIHSSAVATRYCLAFFADDWQQIARIDSEEGEPKVGVGSADSGVIYNIRTYCHYMMGRFDAARRSGAAARPIHERFGNVSATIFLDSFLGLSSYEQLQFDEASSHYSRAFELASRGCAGAAVVSSLPASLLALLHYERDDLPRAYEYLKVAALNTNEFSMPESIIIAALVSSSMDYLEGHAEKALDTLGRAEAHGREGHYDRLIATALCSRLKLLLRAGDSVSAAEVMTEIGALQARNGESGKIAWPRMAFELSCAQARWALARQEWKQAISIIEPLVMSARACAQKLRLVKALILLAAAKRGAGRLEAASLHLGEAFVLAGPARLRRPFLDDLPLIREVMEHALANCEELKAKKLGFGDVAALLKFVQRAGLQVSQSAQLQLSKADEIEPLSSREQAVLRALSLGKTNRGIAESLGIAEGTVAWHMKSILKKMWVANRAEAIAKANRLGLDDRS